MLSVLEGTNIDVTEETMDVKVGTYNIDTMAGGNSTTLSGATSTERIHILTLVWCNSQVLAGA